MEEMNKSIEAPETEREFSDLPYTHCLNCGSELKGKYCYNCGQEALPKTPTVGGFIIEYLNNAFIWDSKFFSTFWTLIRRPGHLTNEYNAGKFASQEHPLKLNMFLLFIFITLFVFFSSAEKMTDSMQTLTNDERVFSTLQLSLMVDNPEHLEKMLESPRDTVLLKAPLVFAENYPNIFSNIETKKDSKGEGFDEWVAILPRVLLEDGVIIKDEELGLYRFNAEAAEAQNSINLFLSIGSEMVRILSQYFPMLLLLTAPFLSFSVRVVHRKSKRPRIHHFIFTLHYLAFLESLMIFIYLLYLTVGPSMRVLEIFLMISSCLYLLIAYHRVYASRWWKATIKSLLTSFVYFSILLLVFIGIFIFACTVTVINMI